MGLNRVTQSMMAERSLNSLQIGMNRQAKIQEQLATGRVLNRPSDSPTDTTSAMRLRSSLADVRQYGRNAEDGNGWLTQLDSALGVAGDAVGRARDLALQGANQGSAGTAARAALAAEVDQIRAGLVDTANTSYLGRPVFGGITAGATAYDATGTFVGTAGVVSRTVGDGIEVRVNVDGPTAFGPAGSSVFDNLEALSNALTAGDQAGIQAALTNLDADRQRLVSARSEVGSRQNRIETAIQAAQDQDLALTTQLSKVENADLPKVLVDLKLQEAAYQVTLASTARVMQPSLVDFLR